MRKFLYLLSVGALTLILLAACTGTGEQGTPTAVGTTVPSDQTAAPPALGTDITGITATATAPGIETAAVDLTATIPTATNIEGAAATGAAQTPVVPVTGADLTSLEGQFCIEGMAHALLVLPDTATFETADTATLSTPGPDMGCNAVDMYKGRQVVICRGQQNTSLNLNVCVDGNNCTPLLVELQSCPQTGAPQPGTVVTDTPAVISPTP